MGEDPEGNSPEDRLETQQDLAPRAADDDIHEDQIAEEDDDDEPIQLFTQAPEPQQQDVSPQIHPQQALAETSVTLDTTHEAQQQLDDNEEEEEEDDDSFRVLLDFVEWWCYRLVVSQDKTQIHAAQEEFHKAVDNLTSHPAMKGKQQPQYGRLFNRMRLAALSLDVGSRKSLLDTSDNKTNLLSHDYWKMIQEEVILLKSLLLRQDANVDVFSKDSASTTPAPNATPDSQLESHAYFQTKYRKVNRLLQVQYHLATFYQKLEQLEASTSTAGTVALSKQVQEALDDYEGQIQLLFGPAPHTKDTGDDVSIVSVASQGSDVRDLPKELTGFLLRDLYQSSSNKNNNKDDTTTTPNLPQRLIRHVEKTLYGKGEYSQNATLSELRQLLAHWHDHVLESPMLVQLGYRPMGVASSEEEESHQPSRQLAEAEEDATLRRMSLGKDAVQMEGPTVLDMQFLQRKNKKRQASQDTTLSQLKDKKRKAFHNNTFVPLKWSDSDHEDDDDQQQQHVDLDALSISSSSSLDDDWVLRKKPKKESVVKSEEPHDNSNSSHLNTSITSWGSGRKKQPFSEEETHAIIKGVHRFGVGKWTLIRDNCHGCLDHRTAVQIKDKYRNLVRSGAVKEA